MTRLGVSSTCPKCRVQALAQSEFSSTSMLSAMPFGPGAASSSNARVRVAIPSAVSRSAAYTTSRFDPSCSSMPPAPASNKSELTRLDNLRGVRTKSFNNIDACSLLPTTDSGAVKAIQVAPVVAEAANQLDVCLELRRFHQVAAGARLVGGRDVVLGLGGAQYHDRDVTHGFGRFHAAQDLEAVDSRQAQIEQHEIRTG